MGSGADEEIIGAPVAAWSVAPASDAVQGGLREAVHSCASGVRASHGDVEFLGTKISRSDALSIFNLIHHLPLSSSSRHVIHGDGCILGLSGAGLAGRGNRVNTLSGAGVALIECALRLLYKYVSVEKNSIFVTSFGDKQGHSRGRTQGCLQHSWAQICPPCGRRFFGR